ncbi:MAG: VanZ family protein [Candidatus Delongbacteria bacterium]|nr:VanZ family protein [Candidatus Delongbacteria bacterium]
MKLQNVLLSPILHLILYSALLVTTPFIMLQHFLQEAIGSISLIKFHLGSLELTALPWTVALIACLILVIVRKQLNLFRLSVIFFGLLMIAVAQQLSDFYFHHNFYDLQQNWHYFAYSGFAWLMYRQLSLRNLPLPRIVLYAFIAALCVSSFDEFFQLKMSNRIFDISDIAKDAWGVLIGTICVVFCVKGGRQTLRSWRLRHPRFKDYLDNAITVILLEMILGLLLLFYSSLLTELEYGWIIIWFTLSTFIVIWLLIHLTQYRIIGPIIYLVVAATLITGGTLYLTKEHQVTHNSYGLTVYRGLPVPFFDIMVFPEGGFRLVDKKHFFNSRDRQTILRLGPDIVVIGSGTQGKGGRGFAKPHPHQFIFNPFTNRGTQVLILPNIDAYRVFNQLKKDGRNVLFILHNTC